MIAFLDLLTFTRVFATIFIILLLRGLYSLFIKPYKQLKLYTQIPGSIVSFNIASKEIKDWKNVTKSNFEPNPSYPVSSIKQYELWFKYPKLRLIATNFLHKIVLRITDPKIIGEYFKNGKYYKKMASQSFMRSLYTCHSLVGIEGEAWKFQRKIISEIFHFENIAKTVPIIEETVKEFLDNIKSNGKEHEVNIIDEFQKITGEIIGRTFFGQNLNDYKLNGKLLTLELADLVIKSATLRENYLYYLLGDAVILFSSEARKIRRETVAFGEFSRQLVRDSVQKIERGEMENQNGRKGLLQILVEKGKAEQGLSEKELVANFISFFVAGMDTTAHSAAMAVYFLSQYPEVKQKVIEEIDSQWDGKTQITQQTIQKLDYMHALLEETLRMATPAPATFPRVAIQDHYLKDVPVKKGTFILPIFTPSMFSEELYKEPCVFRPQRWIKGSEFYERPSDPFAFTPFSAGTNNCIGQHMSLMEAKLILCHFLKKFDFRLIEGYKLEMVLRFLVGPKDPLKFIISKKNDISTN